MDSRRRVAVTLALALALPGCAQTQADGDRLISTYHWSAGVLLAGLCLAMLLAVTTLLVGRRKFTGKPRGAGIVLTLSGLACGVAGGLTIPFMQVTADRELFLVEEGLLGRGVRSRVEMNGLQKIYVYKTRRRHRKRRRLMTIAEFIQKDGDSQIIRVGGDLREPAFEHFLRLAREMGVTIDDRRSDFAP